MSVLNRSGNLAIAKLLHNRVYKVFDMEEKNGQSFMELVLFDDTAFLNGEKLYFVYFDPLLKSIHYNYGKGAAHRSGSLYFSNDFLTILGTIRGEDGKLRYIKGGIQSVKYQAEAINKEEKQSHILEIGTKTEGTMLTPYYCLDGVDITATTACVDVNPKTWETTIAKVIDPTGSGVYDSVSFRIVVDYTGKKFKGTYTEFNLISGERNYTFIGQATQESAETAWAVDRNWKSRDGVGLAHCPHPNRITQKLRDTEPLAGDHDLIELLNINPVEVVFVNDQEKIVDHAQEKAGQYFQDILINHMDEKYANIFFGGKPSLTKNVQKISQAYSKFYSEHVEDNMAQILYDNCRTGGTESQTKACERIKIDKVKEDWKNAGSDNDYRCQANELYIEGYRDGVVSIQPYLKDGVAWAKKMADHLLNPAFLNMWRVQIASLMFSNVKDRIYGFYSKLLVLDASTEGEERAQTVLNTMLGSVVAAGTGLSVYTEENQEVLEELLIAQIEQMTEDPEHLPETLKEYAELYKDVAATFGSIHAFAGKLIHEMGELVKRLPVAADAPLIQVTTAAAEQLAEEESSFQKLWKRAKDKLKPAIGALASGAAAAFMIYSMITTGQKEKLEPKDIVMEISMGSLALVFVLKLGENLMDTAIGKYIVKKLSSSANTFARFAEGFSKWFTKEGVAADNALARFFGKNSATFCRRFLAPAVLLIGIVLSGFMLADTVKGGETYQVVLESINLVFMVGELISWGLAMMGFSWAGPMGAFFAVAGCVVILIEFIWELVSPPKGPVEQYVDNVLVPAGLATA